MENKCLVKEVKNTGVETETVLFCGKEVSKSMHEWAELLCDENPKNNFEFMNLFVKLGGNLTSAVWEYRKLLIDRDMYNMLIPMIVSYDYFNDFEEKEDLNSLKYYLQKIFKEPIDDVGYILWLKHLCGWTWENILDVHKSEEGRYKRLVRIINCDYKV